MINLNPLISIWCPWSERVNTSQSTTGKNADANKAGINNPLHFKTSFDSRGGGGIFIGTLRSQ